jgi:hypothetical protein
LKLFSYRYDALCCLRKNSSIKINPIMTKQMVAFPTLSYSFSTFNTRKQYPKKLRSDTLTHSQFRPSHCHCHLASRENTIKQNCLSVAFNCLLVVTFILLVSLSYILVTTKFLFPVFLKRIVLLYGSIPSGHFCYAKNVFLHQSQFLTERAS